MEKADKETAKYGNFKYDKFRALMQPNKSRRITLKKERNYLTSDDIPGAIAKSPPRHIGRDYIGVSDIAGTRPTKIVPYHRKMNLRLMTDDINPLKHPQNNISPISKEENPKSPYYEPKIQSVQNPYIYSGSRRASHRNGAAKLKSKSFMHDERTSEQLRGNSMTPIECQDYLNKGLAGNMYYDKDEIRGSAIKAEERTRPTSDLHTYISYSKNKANFYGVIPPSTRRIMKHVEQEGKERILDQMKKESSPFQAGGRNIIAQRYELGGARESRSFRHNERKFHALTPLTPYLNPHNKSYHEGSSEARREGSGHAEKMTNLCLSNKEKEMSMRKEFIPSNVPYPARNVPFELKSDASSSRTLSHLRGQERDYRNRNPSPLSTQSINDPTIVKTKPFGRTNIDKTLLNLDNRPRNNPTYNSQIPIGTANTTNTNILYSPNPHLYNN